MPPGEPGILGRRGDPSAYTLPGGLLDSPESPPLTAPPTCRLSPGAGRHPASVRSVASTLTRPVSPHWTGCKDDNGSRGPLGPKPTLHLVTRTVLPKWHLMGSVPCSLSSYGCPPRGNETTTGQTYTDVHSMTHDSKEREPPCPSMGDG